MWPFNRKRKTFAMDLETRSMIRKAQAAEDMALDAMKDMEPTHVSRVVLMHLEGRHDITSKELTELSDAIGRYAWQLERNGL